MSKHSSRGAAWEELRQQQLIAYNFQCAVCGRTPEETGKSHHLDHIIPKSKGGEDTRENTRILCWSCNQSKGDRPDVKEKGFCNPKYYPLGMPKKPGYH